MENNNEEIDKDVKSENSQQKNIKEKKAVEESDYSFIQEKIKDRPINKKRLIKKTIFTGSMAIIFGLIACLTFILLEPFLDKLLDKNSDVLLEQIYLPEASEDDIEPVNVEISETQFEETPLEDMNLEDEVESPSENTIVEQKIVYQSEYEVGLEDYQLLWRKMHALSEVVKKSMVTITSVSEDTDVLNASYQNTTKTYGLIIKSNGYDLMIVADGRNIDDNGVLMVTFCDGVTYEGKLRGVDEQTHLAIYSVPLNALEYSTRENYTESTIGSSYSAFLLGSPIIAVGDPLATGNSLCYGTVTSINTYISFLDSKRQVITTDIYGSTNGVGYLFNVRGQLVGIITPEHHSEEMQNMVYGYGISSIRNLIEDLSNNKPKANVGLYLEDVTQDAINLQGVPEGAYIEKVEPDSPAMEVGLVPGDVITWIGESRVKKVDDYINSIRTLSPGDSFEMRISRLSAGTYKEVTLQITTN